MRELNPTDDLRERQLGCRLAGEFQLTELREELLALMHRTTKSIGDIATTIFHPVGTCKMGSDEHAVVDSDLKVHGLDGLYVADAAIMPTVVSANLNATCIMIGERAAEMIRAAA